MIRCISLFITEQNLNKSFIIEEYKFIYRFINLFNFYKKKIKILYNINNNYNKYG